jgi:hypothetical protein
VVTAHTIINPNIVLQWKKNRYLSITLAVLTPPREQKYDTMTDRQSANEMLATMSTIMVGHISSCCGNLLALSVYITSAIIQLVSVMAEHKKYNPRSSTLAWRIRRFATESLR